MIKKLFNKWRYYKVLREIDLMIKVRKEQREYNTKLMYLTEMNYMNPYKIQNDVIDHQLFVLEDLRHHIEQNMI
jgi:hypothetical protein